MLRRHSIKDLGTKFLTRDLSLVAKKELARDATTLASTAHLSQATTAARLQTSSLLQLWRQALSSSVPTTRNLVTRGLPLVGGAALLHGVLTQRAAASAPVAAIPSAPPPPPLPALSLFASLSASTRTWLSSVLAELSLLTRALFLTILFSPVFASSPLFVYFPSCRPSWASLLRWTLERAGPAFIKWGQWAASRPDLLPRDICRELKKLHAAAPSHSFEHTRKAIESAFSLPLASLFDKIEILPVASGSIAQVHLATLSAETAARIPGHKAGERVAVKVRHPGVEVMMERDFILMSRFAALSRHLPLLHELRLDESIRQFGAPLREQLDLTAEARNLSRFNKNFSRWAGHVSFPRPMYPLVAPAVLTESFEEGMLIDGIVDAPTREERRLEVEAGANQAEEAKLAAVRVKRTSILPSLSFSFSKSSPPVEKDEELSNMYESYDAARYPIAVAGLNSYFKMLLQDNLIHADLHPGNILVRFRDKGKGNVSLEEGKGVSWVDWFVSWAKSSVWGESGVQLPHLVLLDVGMIAELTKRDQHYITEFFTSLTRLDGKRLAESILSFSEHQSCPDPPEFIREVQAKFQNYTEIDIMRNTTEVFGEIMETIRKHHVHLPGQVSTVVVTALVLEGWSSKLDPTLRIMDTLREMLPMRWGERMSRTVDRLMTRGVTMS